jgi:hypothetical protein
MKKLSEVLMVVCLALFACMTMSAESDGRIPASKEARKIAKQWKKEGWIVKGDLPLENQLEQVWMKTFSVTDDGMPIYVDVTSQARSATYDQARRGALEMAKARIASSLGAKIEALIESKIENNQISLEESQSVTEFVSKSKSSVHQRIGKVTPAIECWREHADKTVEVRVMVLYEVPQLEGFTE